MQYPTPGALELAEPVHELLGVEVLLDTNHRGLDHVTWSSAPPPDHYLLLIYVLGLKGDGEAMSFSVAGFDGGSISMTTH